MSRRHPFSLRCLLLAVLVIGGGCYRMIHHEAKREWRWQKRMGKGPERADAALRSARSLIKVPVTKDPARLFRYRIMAIRSITLHMEVHGFDEALDAEAHKYYEEALELGSQADARRELARLYEQTGRRGKLAALLGDAVAGTATGIATQDYDLAIITWRRLLAKGDIAASELAWKRADELAKSLYDVEVTFPADFGARTRNIDASGGRGGLYTLGGVDWRARYAVLRERMSSVASPHDSPTGRSELGELARLWTQYERIGMRSTDDMMGRKSGDTYRVYVDGAKLFGTAGQDQSARKLLAIAQRASIGEVSEFRRADLACADAFVSTHAGASDAAQLAARCLELAKRSERELDIAELIVLGSAFERAAQLDQAEAIYRKAIERAERQRESFPIEERTVFFRTSVRRGYWGLARTLARRSQGATGEAADRDFVGALQATEQVRARQLGELLAGSGKQLGKLGSLATLRERLGPGDVLLDYVAMDDEVMLLAVTRERHAVRFLELDASTVGITTAAIADALATPESSADDLDRALTLLGRALVLPVRELVHGKQRAIVLPDGALNAVPFDLLDLETEGFHPLLERMEVEVTPSLAFMAAAPRQGATGGLFGVGDPTYGDAPELAIADDGARAAARAASAGYFAPLPETRRELEAIAQTMGGNRQLLFGADARESTVKRASLAEYSIVHFATHGILGRDVPGVDEPALVLAGEPGEDGFLTASEASKLQLGAKLTVLSACKTGAGDSASGEGVLGMSRAFMVAGSESVLVSLWSVDSLATESMMVEFYRRMHQGQRPAAALRAAKLAVRDGVASSEASADRGVVYTPELFGAPAVKPSKKSKRKTKTPVAAPPAAPPQRRDHPYYWGAFILVGR
ncbi:MAG: CHAT domain-containing protein [Deltaproteobacteria bacterium]|nr:CHAT domain-containing protein [Nannocystaceae bacterium]